MSEYERRACTPIDSTIRLTDCRKWKAANAIKQYSEDTRTTNNDKDTNKNTMHQDKQRSIHKVRTQGAKSHH